MSKPHKIFKIFGNILFIFLWITALLVFLECCFRIGIWCLHKINPLVRELGEEPPWFYSGKKENSDSEVESVKDNSPLLLEVYRAKFFWHLDERDKNLFANLRELIIYYKGRKEDSYKIISCKGAKEVDNEIELERVTFTTYPELEDTEFFYYPSYKINGRVIYDFFGLRTLEFEVVWYREKSMGEENGNNPWKIPFFEYKRNFSIPGYEFRTNNFGFRDDDIELPKPPDTYRIIAVGGSTTEEGPTSAQTYPNILENLFSEKLSDNCKVEVINCGIPGITLNKIWIRLPDFLLLQPDLIILSEGVNDITHILIPYWLQNMSWNKKCLANSDLMIWLSPTFFLPGEGEIRMDLINTSLSYIRKISDYLVREKVGLVITDLPAPNYHDMTLAEKIYFQYVTKKWWGGRIVDYRMYEKVLSTYNELLREFAGEKKIPLVKLSKEFMNEPSSTFVDLCHMRLKGIEKKAIAVYSKVIEFLPGICNKTIEDI